MIRSYSDAALIILMTLGLFRSILWRDCCFNKQYIRKLQSVRHQGDSGGAGDVTKTVDSGSGSSWWRGASWTSVVDVVLISGRQMARLDVSSDVYVKFKFASERYKTRVRLTSLIVIIIIIVIVMFVFTRVS